jgi:hypothetical protein
MLDKIIALGSKSSDQSRDSLMPDFMILAYNGSVGDILWPPILNAVGLLRLLGPLGAGGDFFVDFFVDFLVCLTFGAAALGCFGGDLVAVDLAV